MAGGLGSQGFQSISNLSQRRFYHSSFLYRRPPSAKERKYSRNGKLILHRWCQWISDYHPAGVYQGENRKAPGLYQNLFPLISWNILLNRLLKKIRLVVILAEEWHTAEVICKI